MDKIEKCIQLISYLHDKSAEIYRNCGFDPMPGSKAAIELNESNEKDILETAFSQGSMLIEISADQVMAYAKTISNPMQTIAPWTVARSVMESSALGMWLLDVEIDKKDRIERSYAFRFEGLMQQRKFYFAIKKHLDEKAVTKRITKVVEKAEQSGHKRVSDKNGKIIGVGCKMPSITQIIKETFDQESWYRLLSASIHSHFWALHELCFENTSVNGQEEKHKSPNGVNLYLMRKRPNLQMIVILSYKVISFFSRFIWTKFKIYGFQDKELIEVFENIYNQLTIKNMAQRFWLAR